MTAEEAAEILGPDICAQVDAFAATAPPLSDTQQTQLRALFATPSDCQADTPDVA